MTKDPARPRSRPRSRPRVRPASAPDSGPDPAPTGLADEREQAVRHGLARAGRASAVLEDYLELIDDLVASEGEARPTDLARRLGVSHPTAIKSVARLKALGLVTSKPYRSIFLTEAGRALACKVRARHRVVVDLLQALGVPPEVAERDAEGIEHHVGDVTLEAFRAFLRRIG